MRSVPFSLWKLRKHILRKIVAVVLAATTLLAPLSPAFAQDAGVDDAIR
jgi:hypothetical protein